MIRHVETKRALDVIDCMCGWAFNDLSMWSTRSVLPVFSLADVCPSHTYMTYSSRMINRETILVLVLTNEAVDNEQTTFNITALCACTAQLSLLMIYIGKGKVYRIKI